ncbi:MAG: type II secretion system F family protein [Pseudomonadota bacterium]
MNAEKRWRYAAETGAGAVVAGIIEAPDARAAEAALKARRLLPLTVKEQQSSLLSGLNVARRGDRLTMKELAELSARLRDLLCAGIPIAPAIKLASEQATSPREGAFLKGLLADVRGGRSLTDALQRSAYETPRLFRALIEAGEALGALGKQMERLAAHYDEALKLRREILAQFAYPAALVVLIIATLIFLSFVVLPQFEAIFATADAKPPPETQFVLAAGAAVRRYWPLAPVIALGSVLTARYAARRNAAPFERLRLSAPVAGRILRYGEYASFLRTLATLLDGGAPIAKAMPLARAAMSVETLKAEVEDAEGAVRVGERLAPAIRKHTSCPADLVSFLEIGEETGDLARLAAQAATRAETLVRSSLKRLMALLAPVLTALMGLLTAGVIAAVMTGVLSLNEAVY